MSMKNLLFFVFQHNILKKSNINLSVTKAMNYEVLIIVSSPVL